MRRRKATYSRSHPRRLKRISRGCYGPKATSTGVHRGPPQTGARFSFVTQSGELNSTPCTNVLDPMLVPVFTPVSPQRGQDPKGALTEDVEDDGLADGGADAVLRRALVGAGGARAHVDQVQPLPHRRRPPVRQQVTLVRLPLETGEKEGRGGCTMRRQETVGLGLPAG